MFIAIDGMVGAGKSTLARKLSKKGFVPFYEPFTKNPVLEKFYKDKSRFSLASQIFFINERFKHIKKASKIKNAVIDRSIYGDSIFAKMLMESGNMTELEYSIYEELLNNMLFYCPKPTLMIYLKISTEKAIERIKKRGRDYEIKVKKDYWESLNYHYEQLFSKYNNSPLLIINVDNLDFENNLKDEQYVLNLIEQKLFKLQ